MTDSSEYVGFPPFTKPGQPTEGWRKTHYEHYADPLDRDRNTSDTSTCFICGKAVHRVRYADISSWRHDDA